MPLIVDLPRILLKIGAAVSEQYYRLVWVLLVDWWQMVAFGVVASNDVIAYHPGCCLDRDWSQGSRATTV